MSSRTSTNPKLASRGKSSDGPKGVAGGKRGGTRAASGKARANRNAGAVAHPMAQSPGILKFYTDDAPGIKMCVYPRSPNAPLFRSLRAAQPLLTDWQLTCRALRSVFVSRCRAVLRVRLARIINFRSPPLTHANCSPPHPRSTAARPRCSS